MSSKRDNLQWIARRQRTHPHSKETGREIPLLNVKRLRLQIRPQSARDPLRVKTNRNFIIPV